MVCRPEKVFFCRAVFGWPTITSCSIETLKHASNRFFPKWCIPSPTVPLNSQPRHVIRLHIPRRIAGLVTSYGVSGERIDTIARGNILKGAKPANLPVQQATKFELVIKTARRLASRSRSPRELHFRSCCDAQSESARGHERRIRANALADPAGGQDGFRVGPRAASRAAKRYSETFATRPDMEPRPR
jgi:hypothetical protein